MNFQIPTDQHELDWLTHIAVSAHCDIAANGRSSQGFGAWCTSTVSHLLAEARHAKGYEYGGKLLPMLGALSAMDQFGACYEPISTSLPGHYASKSGIIKSAHNFLEIDADSPDSDALYALRNSLMHQSSLISVGQQKNNPKHFWFEIDNSINNTFTHAEVAWDGAYNTRTANNKTLVNKNKVLELAFKLNKKLINLHNNGKLRLTLPGGLRELLTNYVEIEFEISFRDSYVFYLATKISDSLSCPSVRAANAETVLKKVSKEVLNEAAAWLAPQLNGESSIRLFHLYPEAIAIS